MAVNQSEIISVSDPLTIYFGVAVCHGWDSDEHLTAIPLHHQLQLPTRLLDQLPCVAQRQVLCDRTVNLTHQIKYQ